LENGAGLFPSVWRLGSPDSFSREWFAISFLLGWLALKLLNLTQGVRSAEYGSDPSGASAQGFIKAVTLQSPISNAC
jgi:hypothetical protein